MESEKNIRETIQIKINEYNSTNMPYIDLVYDIQEFCKSLQENTKKEMFKFVEWCDDNCCYINHDTGLWESQLLGIDNYTTNQLYLLYTSEE